MGHDRQLALLEAIARSVGVTPSVSGVTVGWLFVKHKLSRPRGRAWQLERNLLRPFIVRHWRHFVSELGPSDWDAHRAQRRQQPTRTGNPPTELTVNLELARTKQMFRWGVDYGHISADPFARCKKVKTRTRRGSYFTAPQIHMLSEAGMALRWHHQVVTFRALVAVMARTGLHISEALSLRWDRLRLDGTAPIIGKGSRAGEIGFPVEAIEAMRQLDRHPRCPFVFVNYKRGNVYNASTVRAWFQVAVKAAGLESVKAKGDFHLVPHILRHSAASMADERGVPLAWIQRMLRHSDPRTTLVYMHREEREAAMRMALLMSDRKPPRTARKNRPAESLPTKKEFASSAAKKVEYLS